MTSTQIILVAVVIQASALAATSQTARCIESSRLALKTDTRVKPSHIVGRFTRSKVTGIAIRVVEANVDRAAILFCLDASRSSKSFAIFEDERIGFSATWRKIGPREARGLKLDFDDYPVSRGDVLGMFWEGAGVAVLFWNGARIEYRILTLRTAGK